jgi:Arc/MetJ-type ribon-helix-helix transcriptional regulator
VGIVLNPELERRIAAQIESGAFGSADEVRDESLKLLETRNGGSQKPAKTESVWEIAARIRRDIPEEALASLPRDLSKNVDRYLYGAPRVEEGKRSLPIPASGLHS